MTPKEKTEQIEKGDNWIVEFWRVRGYDVVKTALGIEFTLHRREPEYESLGLNLTYLEQFRDEVIKKVLSDLEDWNNCEGLNLRDVVDRLKSMYVKQKGRKE